MRFPIVAAAVLCLSSTILLPSKASAAEPPKNIPESVADTLNSAETAMLSIVEAMPEDKYNYIPTTGKFEDARNFGEQVKHVACAQFGFSDMFNGKTPPPDCPKGGPDPAKTKAELITYLKKSFDYTNETFAKLTPENAMDRVDGQYGGPTTKLGIAILSVWHLTDHYGQLVVYLRLNGIIPPRTVKNGLKVR